MIIKAAEKVFLVIIVLKTHYGPHRRTNLKKFICRQPLRPQCPHSHRDRCEGSLPRQSRSPCTWHRRRQTHPFRLIQRMRSLSLSWLVDTPTVGIPHGPEIIVLSVLSFRLNFSNLVIFWSHFWPLLKWATCLKLAWLFDTKLH